MRVHYRVDAPSAWDPCFSHAQIQTAVTRALGRTVFFEAGESDVLVELQTRPGWGARVRLLDSAGQRLGTRHLRGKDCNELRELVVFTLAVMVDFRSNEVSEKRSAAQAEPDDGDEVRDQQGDDSASLGEKEPRSNVASPSSADEGREPWPALTPSLGLSVDAGATPLPRYGVYGALALEGSGAFSLLVRGRGEHMPELSRADSQLSAWAVSATLAGCWGSRRQDAAWSYRACLGLTPDWLWVVAQGDEGSSTSGFGGLAAEPNVLVNTPSLGAITLELGVGLGVPVVRNSWHAATSSGAELPLFRAADVRLVGFVGGVLGR